MEHLEKVQLIASEVKEIAQESNTSVQSANIDDTTTDNVVAAPMVTKSVTNVLLWVMVGATIGLSIAGGICMIVFDKDISTVIMQFMGYTVPVSLGCLAKKGVENVATTKYENTK